MEFETREEAKKKNKRKEKELKEERKVFNMKMAKAKIIKIKKK